MLHNKVNWQRDYLNCNVNTVVDFFLESTFSKGGGVISNEIGASPQSELLIEFMITGM